MESGDFSVNAIDSQFVEVTVRKQLLPRDFVHILFIWLLLLVADSIFAAALFLLSASLWASLVIWILILLLFVPFAVGMLQIEFEYSLFSGEFRVAKILGKRRRRDLAEIPILAIDRIGMCSPLRAAGLSNEQFEAVYDFSSAQQGPLSENTWFLVYHGDESEKYLIYFDMTDAMRRYLESLRRSAFSAEK